MKTALKHLWLLIVLIGIASSILLLSDTTRRNQTRPPEQRPSIAIIQYVSTPLLDEHVRGVIDELQQQGCLDRNNQNLRMFNAQGDNSLAASIAREAVEGDYDLLITSSTMSLQSVANANRNTGKPHVFGGVTDPYGTGVDITGTAPGDHPPYLAGIGSFQPVAELFQIAKELNPALQRVGVLWNPAEQCSTACMKKARASCAELGIELIEATANNASEVNESLRALLSKQVEAIWIGGDTVATAAARFIIKKASETGIPVLTNDPTDAAEGALIGLGADYYSVGKYTGALAAEIINGRDPATIPIKNVVPQKLQINQALLRQLPGWKMTPHVQSQLYTATAAQSPEPGRQYRIGLSYFAPSPGGDLAIDGFRIRLAERGFIEGKNLTLDSQHANGDISLLAQTTQSLLSKQPDVLVAFTTPCLGSAIAQADGKNIVFGIVSAPLQAGAGESFQHHKPNVTGVVQTMPAPELFDYLNQLDGGIRRIGVLYNPAEANSLKEIADLERIFATRGLELAKKSVTTPSEIPEGILALLSRQVDAVFLTADNTVVCGTPAILNACQAENIPVFCEDSGTMGHGIFMACGPGMRLDGAQTADLTIRVLLGESPALIPMEPSHTNELYLDFNAAAKAAIQFPVSLLKKADHFFHLSENRDRPAHIALINLVHAPGLDAAVDGILNGLTDRGLAEGSDYTLTHFNAQGDVSMVPQQMDAALATDPDLIITVTTPVQLTAANRIKETPVVFTVASNPADLGFKPGTFPSNITGVYEALSAAPLLQMICRHHPTIKKIGALYDASQPNAVIAARSMKAEVQAAGLEWKEITITSIAELAMATSSLIQQGVEVITIGSDNLTSSGFPAIIQTAKAQHIPVYTNNPDQVKQGASGAVGCDYFAWGHQAGRMAAGILAGIPLLQQPMETQQKTISREAPEFDN